MLGDEAPDSASELTPVEEFCLLASWIAGVHDIGKCTPAFSVQVPGLDDRMKEAGLSHEPVDPLERRKVPHALAGQLILEPLEERFKTSDNLIEGCQSRVWLTAAWGADGRITFRGDSDAVIVKGIVSLLIRVLSGHTPSEITASDLYFIDRIGLKEHLSPTRSNGLVSMLKQMKMYAVAFQAKEE